MKLVGFVLVSLAALMSHITPALAQGKRVETDSGRLLGRVTDRRQHVVVGARVVVHAIAGTFVDSAVTDTAGRYSLVLPQKRPVGSILVSVTAVGFAPSRAVIDSTTTEHDVVLSSPATALAPVHVVEKRERPSIPQFLAPTIGGLGTAASGSAGTLTSTSYSGDILGFAAGSAALDVRKSGSGRVDGIATMGLGPDQTSITMDGADVRGVHIPRDAQVAVRTATSVYDPSEGGFSGAKVDIVTTPGANIGFAVASLSAATNALGGPAATLTGSASASGNLLLDRVMYSSSAEFYRNSMPLTTFGGPGSSSQLRLSSSDASELETGLHRFGINSLYASPRAVGTGFSTLDRVDFVSDSDHSMALIAHASDDASSPFAGSPDGLGNLFGHAQSIDAGLTMERTALSDRFAQQTSISLDETASGLAPFRNLPLLQIQTPGVIDGVASIRDVLAGSLQSTSSISRTVSITARHIVRLGSPSGHHKPDAGVSLRFVRDNQDPTSNLFGTISYDSISTFAAGSASAYSRIVNPARSVASVGTLSGFVGDLWVPRPLLSVQGGVRVDFNAFSIPGGRANTTLADTALGRPSTTLGRSLDVSPRLGITWDIPTSGANVAGYAIRAGFGRFVNDVRGDALLVASLPFVGAGSPRRLACNAGNLPGINWADGDRSNLPVSCSDGTLPTAENSTGSLVARDWKPPATWRGNIGGTIRLQRPLTVSADIAFSATTRISSNLAANLSPIPSFTLTSEANRPVFTSAASLRNASVFGYVGTPQVRPALGAVAYVVSDMDSYAHQLLLGLLYHPIGATSIRINYAYTNASERTRGLDGTTSGDPRVTEWSPVASASHIATLSLFRKYGQGAMILQGRIESGAHYTPLVAGDANGDGQLDDRAYVAAPGDPDSTLAHGIERLIAVAPPSARACLRRALGGIAAQNSCVGPWTASLDGTIFMPLGPASAKHRPRLQLEVLNMASGIDAMLHGGNHMRGWGGYGTPDNILMTSTGFDDANRRFGYVINPAFGSVRVTSPSENPFGVRLTIMIPLARDPVAQQLAIDASRRSHPSMASLIDRYVAEYPNVGFEILDVADSVGLGKTQRDSLVVIGREFDATLRTIWRPVVKQIEAGLPVDAATHIIKAARTPAAINYNAFAVMVRAILNPNQLARLPATAKWVIRPDALMTMGLAP